MIGQGINIDKIRELNKIKVYGVNNDGLINTYIPDVYGIDINETGLIFSAYLTQPIGQLSAKVSSSSLTQDVGNMIKGMGVVGKLANSAITTWLTSSPIAGIMGQGVSFTGNLNYNYNYRFTEVDGFSHSFSCELVTKQDYVHDVIKPLFNILAWVMPTETDKTGDREFYKNAKAWIEEYWGKLKNWGNDKLSSYVKPELLNKMWQGLGDIGGEVNDMASSLSVYMKPPQLSNGNSHSRIVIGNYIQFDNVIIESVNFTIPHLYYEGGLFDKVDVTLTVKGNRGMSIKTFDWLRDIKNTADGGFSSYRRSLNYDYETPPPTPDRSVSSIQLRAEEEVDDGF